MDTDSIDGIVNFESLDQSIAPCVYQRGSNARDKRPPICEETTARCDLMQRQIRPE